MFDVLRVMYSLVPKNTKEHETFIFSLIYLNYTILDTMNTFNGNINTSQSVIET